MNRAFLVFVIRDPDIAPVLGVAFAHVLLCFHLHCFCLAIRSRC